MPIFSDVLACVRYTLWTRLPLFCMSPAIPDIQKRLQQPACSGCCSRPGAERFALLRGLVETARQRQWPLLDFLRLGPDAAVLLQPVPP